MKKRLLSAFMALALCLTLLPAPAWAEETDAPEGGAPAADEQPGVQSEPAPQAAVQAAEVPAENAVAQVGNVNYANITDAFAAVKGNGGTLTLLASCETPNTNQRFDISGNYTLDLNGCTLKGQLYLSKTSTSLTVKDSGTGGKIQATSGWSPLWVDGGDVTIESGTLATEKDTVQALVFGQEAACGTLTITGGSFKTGYVYIGYDGGKTVISDGDFHELRVNGDYSKRVTLSGGTFDTVMRRKSGSTIAPTDLLADGYTFVNRGTDVEVSTSQEAALTNVKVVSKETVNALVSLTVDGTKTHYGTFEEALTAAQKTQGGTLTLLNNVTTTPTDINSGTFTLDLNGHTLTSGYNATLVVIGGSLTIQDSKGGGVISSTSSDSKAVWCGGGNVTILGGSFQSALYWESGTVSLQGGAFRSLDSKAGSWLSAIPEGKALERDGQITDASAKTIHTADGFYVLADHKEHNWQEGRCACGREHTDHTWKDGKCTVCHLPCSHGTIGGDGVCMTCGTQFTVRDDDGNYYKHLADALAIESVDDVTLVADDTLSEDVMLIKDIFFYPNGHTVSGEGAIVVPRGKRLVLGEKDETEKAGNAGAIRVEDGGTLMVDEGFTGTVQTLTVSETADVKLSGGTYRTITGSRQKAGTLLYNDNNHALAFQKQDGSFARYDQRISSETPLENVTVDFCRHEQLTEACGETCEYCGGALRCRIGAAGYRDMSNAIRDVPDGGTITLLRDYSAVNNISANVDRAYTIDLNGHSVQRNSGGISLAVYAGTPKIIDSKGGGVIAGLEIDSSLDLTLADLLPEGWDFQKSDGSWLSTTDLEGKTASDVTVAQLPIQSMNYPTEMSMTYGGTGMLQVKVAKEPGAGAVTFQWYKVEDGNETAVGSATPKSQFDLSALKLPAGNHTFRFSATCDGYEKMSKDIVITVQKADIGSNRITPPTAQENLTYTGQAQALITAGSVTSGGTMQYSLTENGTYSPDIPTGTDAGAYTVWYRVIGDANHKDTAPASVAVRIGQKPLTITGVTVASKLYDGTTNADITSVTFDNVTLKRDTDYNVTASFDDAGAGNVKNITAIVTLMEQTAKNYALEQSSVTTTASITKAAAPDFTKETALVIVNGHEKTYTVTLPDLPTLETPKEYGAPTYELGEIKLDGRYYTSGAKVENGKLILPIQKNDVKTTGSVGTVTVVIKSANYEDITLTVNVNATNKLVPTVTAPTANALTYNGAEQALVIAGKTTGGTMLYRLDDSEWSEQLPTAKNAGEYTVWYKVQGDAEYADVAEQSLTVSAAKKVVTVTALNQSAYTGSTAPDLSSPEADKNYKVEGLVDADTLNGTVTLTYEQTPDMSKTGKTAINITGTLSNDNYAITYVPGTLTVSNQPSSGGGSSSGGSSSGGGTVKTETTKNNDGSVTKTETQKDGTVIETTTGKDGSVSKTETRKDGSSVTETKAADGSTGTVKTDKNGQTTAETTLSSKAIETAKRNGELVTAPVEVEATRDSSTAPTVKIELPRNSGDTKVEIPVTNVKPGTVAVLVHPDGTEEIVKNSLPTEDGIQLTVNGGATVKIVDNSKDFIDTRAHWAKDAIDFVSARGLVNGMNAVVYAPNASTTRAQLWTILARQNNADLTGGATWFENAQNWAKEKGISDGANPNGTINRAQMVTMLWRAMGRPAAASGVSFADVPADSYYAQAVAWAIENGITAGVGGGRFDPNSTCTRGQIATFLYRYMK
ncbi:S-layer homology domain-containing protein [Neopoerus faecalis]|uniref:S-layer homology domain-containing protein n=1 Tax=Neopoerus faecalis TaxID=3032125 RepID=UPI0025703253|nr:S-layer homology domain-containing protein [Neopoerus faecalis]